MIWLDFPHDVLLANMRANVSRNADLLSGEAVVVGHLWGQGTQALLGAHASIGAGFDVAIVAECLWLHHEHCNLLDSIMMCLAHEGKAYICFSHHVPGVETKDMAFFDKAIERYSCQVEHLRTFQVQAVFNSRKTKDQFLYCITKLEP